MSNASVCVSRSRVLGRCYLRSFLYSIPVFFFWKVAMAGTLLAHRASRTATFIVSGGLRCHEFNLREILHCGSGDGRPSGLGSRSLIMRSAVPNIIKIYDLFAHLITMSWLSCSSPTAAGELCNDQDKNMFLKLGTQQTPAPCQ